MSLIRITVLSALLLALAGSALAKESGGFVVKLGTDTVSVERYVRDGDRIEVDQVGRSPRTLQRHFVYELKNDVPVRFSLVVTPPGSTTPTQTIDARVDGDTLRYDVKNGPNTQNNRLAIQKGTLMVPLSAPWSQYELLTTKLARGKADSVSAPMYFVGAGSTNRLMVRRVRGDSADIATDRGDLYRAKLDKSGHILGVRPLAGTQQFSATRENSVDVAAWTASFAAREQAGGGMGVLSPRDTVRATVGGANVTIDYGRPSKRGRVVFGGLVPYGEVWRTGANGATQIRTDKDLVINGQTVPAGFYTVWTMPTASGWKLMLNSQTGQWGTEHDASKDVFTFDMKVEPQTAPVERFTIAVEPAGDGGVLSLGWDTTRATLPFTVKSQ